MGCMVENGIARRRRSRQSVVCHSMAQHGVALRSHALHIIALQLKAWHRTAEHNIALHCMPWHGTGNDASAAAGARFGTSGSAEMRPALQREHDSEGAEPRK